MKHTITLGLLVFLFSNGAFAQSSRSLTLNDALALARDRNIEMVLAEERVKQAYAKKNQAFSVILPHISMTTYQQRQTRDLGSQGIPLPSNVESQVGPFNSFDLRLRINQMLFDRASIERFFTVEALHRLSQAQVRKAQQDVMALVATLYLDAERGIEKSQLSQLIYAREKRRLRIAHRLWRTGRLKLFELHQTKALFKESYVRWFQAKMLADNGRYDLLTALGFALEENVELDRRRTLSENHVPTEAEIVTLLTAHPDNEVRQLSLEEKQHETRIFISEYLPKFMLFGDYGLTGKDPGNSDDTYTFGVQGIWDFYDGGQRAHKMEESKSQERSAQAQLEDTKRQLTQQARIAREALEQAFQMLKAKDIKLAAAYKELDQIDIRFNNGSASQWDLINESVETALIADERAEAVSAYLLAKVNFYHSLGKMETMLKE